MEDYYIPKVKESQHGYFIDNVCHIFTEDSRVYDLESGELLCVFLKGVLPLDPLDDKIVKVSKSISNNRGNASGKMDIRYHSDNIDYFIDKPDLLAGKKIKHDGTSTRSSAYPVRKDGTLIKRTRGNNVRSVSVGSFNATNTKGGETPCRLTNWTQRNTDSLVSLDPIMKKCQEEFKKWIPDKYEEQVSFCNKINKWRIRDSIFSTITLNYDFRTAVHTDKGDLKTGMTCFSVREYGEWSGSELCFPDYDFGVDVREGDLLIFNPHLAHCNRELKGTGRLSMVLYCREKLIDCPVSNQDKFTEIYDKKIWKLGEGALSGSGSNLSPDNQYYMKLLHNTINDYQIKSVCDIGCGDWSFSKMIDWNGIDYLGIDCVQSVIDNNINNYQGQSINFKCADAVSETIKGYDLILLKDAAQHWEDKDIREVITQLLNNNKFILFSNGFKFGRTPEKNDWEIRDINNKYSYHPVDINKEPMKSIEKNVLWTTNHRYKQFNLMTAL